MSYMWRPSTGFYALGLVMKTKTAKNKLKHYPRYASEADALIAYNALNPHAPKTSVITGTETLIAFTRLTHYCILCDQFMSYEDREPMWVNRSAGGHRVGIYLIQRHVLTHVAACGHQDCADHEELAIACQLTYPLFLAA